MYTWNQGCKYRQKIAIAIYPKPFNASILSVKKSETIFFSKNRESFDCKSRFYRVKIARLKQRNPKKLKKLKLKTNVKKRGEIGNHIARDFAFFDCNFPTDATYRLCCRFLFILFAHSWFEISRTYAIYYYTVLIFFFICSFQIRDSKFPVYGVKLTSL